MIEAWRKKANEFLAERAHVIKTLKAERDCLTISVQKVGDIEEAQRILQGIAQTVQTQAHERIARVVSRCLSAVFDEPYTLKIHFDRKRGKTEARLAFERDGKEIDPLTASGGGVVALAAFALRLACLVLSRPPLRRLLVLDEPMAQLSADHRDRVRQLLIALTTETGVQALLVTHSPELETGRVHRM